MGKQSVVLLIHSPVQADYLSSIPSITGARCSYDYLFSCNSRLLFVIDDKNTMTLAFTFACHLSN